jgi:hypothetical protein
MGKSKVRSRYVLEQRLALAPGRELMATDTRTRQTYPPPPLAGFGRRGERDNPPFVGAKHGGDMRQCGCRSPW